MAKRRRKLFKDQVIPFVRHSSDKRTFFVRVECSDPMSFHEGMMYVYAFTKDQLDQIDRDTRSTVH